MDFFVVTNGDWIITYNKKCKEISRMSKANKEVVLVSGISFVTYNGIWRITYNKHCRETARISRPK